MELAAYEVASGVLSSYVPAQCMQHVMTKFVAISSVDHSSSLRPCWRAILLATLKATDSPAIVTPDNIGLLLQAIPYPFFTQTKTRGV
jgi:hypothetical protein